MTEVKKIPLSAVSQPALANYDFVDVANRTGYISFYGMHSATTTYSLTPVTVYSENLDTQAAMTGTADFVKELDIDFDITLSKPLLISGYVFVNVPLYVQKTGGTSAQIKCRVYLRKFANAVETDLYDSGFGQTFTATAGSSKFVMDCFRGSLTTQILKVGEVLRLTVELYGIYNGGGTAGNLAIGHDPENRSTDGDSSLTWTTPTLLRLKLPTKIDI